jgi:hypothetical protein
MRLDITQQYQPDVSQANGRFRVGSDIQRSLVQQALKPFAGSVCSATEWTGSVATVGVW